MALFFECTEKCAPNLLDTADIVRDAMLRQLRAACPSPFALGAIHTELRCGYNVTH
jgi:hypothetical protein